MLRSFPVILALSVLTISAASKAGCPDFNLLGPWGCAYMPKCYGDSMCPAGQQCCSHPCGDQCAAIVHCAPVDCSGILHVCQHGFKKDLKGCPTCTCKTDATQCKTLACILANGNPGIVG